MTGQAIYRPGVAGWVRFAFRYSPRGAVKQEWLRDTLRRARLSARLRQSETERAYWKNRAVEKVDES